MRIRRSLQSGAAASEYTVVVGVVVMAMVSTLDDLSSKISEMSTAVTDEMDTLGTDIDGSGSLTS